MKIAQVIGREIFDSRGMPTVECELILEDGMSVRASVPSGASVGSYEAHVLLDADKRLGGKGVTSAIDAIERIIAPRILKKEPSAVETDLMLISLDGTNNKSKLGANSLLAVSMAMYRAHAYVEGMTLYEFIAQVCDFDTVMVPRPFFNMINGGAHADNNLAIQEHMVVPVGACDYRSALSASMELYHILKRVLSEDGKSTLVGDEGGFAPIVESQTQALDYLMKAIDQATKEFGYDSGYFALALDVAASSLFDKKKKKYIIGDKAYDAPELVDWYSQLLQSYPICSIEDGLSEDDWDGWQIMSDALGDKVQLVGDDIFATNKDRIVKGMEQGVANTVLIKPNQIGTVTQTLQAIRLCQENEYNVMISHRSGETTDTFIADLAVGTHAGQIKAGGCSRGERIAKYNQLLRIEDELSMHMLDN